MDTEEEPLLHGPDLALAILRAAGPRAATLADAAEHLHQDRRVAGEPEPPSLDDRLAETLRHLAAAQLVDMLDATWFRITPRGRAVLDRHPDGIDDSVLMTFPEFRDWLDRTHAPHPREDTRMREFQRGQAAFDQGGELTDNPYPTDTAQHAAWEDGWLEAERRGREGPAPRR